jgi:hypothetical protein
MICLRSASDFRRAGVGRLWDFAEDSSEHKSVNQLPISLIRKSSAW